MQKDDLRQFITSITDLSDAESPNVPRSQDATGH